MNISNAYLITFNFIQTFFKCHYFYISLVIKIEYCSVAVNEKFVCVHEDIMKDENSNEHVLLKITFIIK